MKAYVATVTRTDGGLILGGVTRHACHPMETWEMAMAWADVVKRENQRAMKSATFTVHIREVSHPNPIREFQQEK